MSNMEIFIIVCVCLVPIVALVVLFPKLKLKRKEKKEKEIKETAQPTEKYVPETSIVENPTPKVEQNLESVKYDPSEFRDYLNQKKDRTKRPTRNELPAGFRDMTSRYDRNYGEISANTNKNSLAKEIQSLSPELKALIISGALDRKDFDEE